jgi:O-antigen/teichoic acid export membrane protein
MPWTLMSAYRPDYPAKLVMFEAPMYLALLYGLIRHFGIEGAAVAWTCRSAFNCTVLHLMMWRALPQSARAIKKNGVMLAMGVLAVVCTLMLPAAIGPRVLYLGLALTAMIGVTWFWVMSAEERMELAPAWRFS